MNDIEFYDELKQIVARRGAAMHLVDTIAFVSEVAERLEEDPVFGEFVEVEYSGIGKRNRQFRIHGFTQLDESDGTIGLVIGKWSDADAPETLVTSVVNQLSSQLESFVEESVNERLNERVPEVNGGYELSTLLRTSGTRLSRIRLHILSNQPLSQRFKEELCGTVAGIPIERHVWDLQRLKALYQSSREREAVQLVMAEFGSEGIECMEAVRSERIQSYLCVISGTILADMFERYGSRLLEGNVRSFLGMKGGVNKGIRATVQDAPQLFFAYNNGIAATAASVKIELIGGRSRITEFLDLQIVNGGQTTSSILNARKKDKLPLDGIAVPMKLTVVSGSEAIDLIPHIAEYANTQNKVAIADFFANHPFHRKMEEISRRMSVPVRTGIRIQSKWFYERARGQYQNERLYLTDARKAAFDLEYPSAQVINKTDLAKYDSAWNEKPHWLSLGAQKNFIKFASRFESGDPDISGSDQWNAISPRFGDAYYQQIVALAILWKQTELIVSSGRGDWYQGDYRAQIVSYGLSMYFRALRNNESELDLEKIWRSQGIPQELRETVKTVAISAQEVILSPPFGMTNVGEWAKREACWEKAKASIQPLAHGPNIWTVSTVVAKQAKVEARKQGVQDDGIALQKLILELVTLGYWSALLQWPKLSDVVTPMDRSLLSRASTISGFMRINIEKNWRKLIEIRQSCEDAGFRHR